MIIVKLIEFLRTRLKLVIRICIVILILLVVLDALPFIVHKEGHAHTLLEKFPAFWSVFGFFSCALIILLSKLFGQAGIMQKEDFYDE